MPEFCCDVKGEAGKGVTMNFTIPAECVAVQGDVAQVSIRLNVSSAMPFQNALGKAVDQAKVSTLYSECVKLGADELKRR